MKHAAIFDVDGSLHDVSGVRHYVARPPGKKDFNRFHAESVNCPPHWWVVDLARQAAVDGLDVLVATGRMETWRYHTLYFLWERAVPYKYLLMRDHGDYRKDYEVKRDMLARIFSMGYRVHFAVDDNPAILKLWREFHIPTIEVPGWESD